MRGFPFVGRENELATLENEYAQGDGFVVIYGRRRVGKTTLINHFIRDKEALYFMASREDDAVNLRRFAKKVSEFIGDSLLANVRFDDWRTPFEMLVKNLNGRPCIIALDEFPYLVAANKAMPSIMQSIWDETLAGSNVTLILCGSSVSMMHDEVLSSKSPLFGRRTAQIRLTPFSFRETRQALAKFTYEQAIEVHAITGGVPKYLEFFCSGRSIMDNVKQHVLSNSGYLYQEPEFLLAEETRGTSSYLSILSAIAQGNRKVAEMTNFLGRRAQDLTPYLSTLISLGYAQRNVPFNERYPQRSKNGLYRVSDGFMAFWLLYVEPFASELEMGNMQPSLEAMQRTFRSWFVPFAFEQVAREDLARLCLEGSIDFSPSRISGYWNRTASIELDVCADDTQYERTFLGECKYYERKPVGMSEYHRLAEKAQMVPQQQETLLGLFSHTGFTEELLECAKSNEHLVLVNQGERVR